MDISEIKGNSHAMRAREAAQKEAEPQKKLTKVVKGPVKKRQKSGLSKVADTFLAEDMSTVKSSLLMDVIIPGIKDLISDVLKDGIDLLFHGGTVKRSVSSGDRFSAPYINYAKMKDKKSQVSGTTNRLKNGYHYDDIILSSRVEADEVLSQLEAALDQYEIVTVADLYDLVGEPHNYTDNKYGWTNLRNAEIVRVRGGGYMIKMPKAFPID